MVKEPEMLNEPEMVYEAESNSVHGLKGMAMVCLFGYSYTLSSKAYEGSQL